jgi:hypothetical protein
LEKSIETILVNLKGNEDLLRFKMISVMNYFYKLGMKIENPKSLQSSIESFSSNSFPLSKSIYSSNPDSLTESIDSLNLSDLEILVEHERMKYSTLLISIIIQTNFKEMDKEFEKFGKFYLNLIRRISKRSDLVLDSFSKLMLNNIGFSNSELFPEVDIQWIKSKLEVELLLSGKYFRLLPNLLGNCCDLKFHFE